MAPVPASATLLHVTAGAALVLAAWLAPRRIARARIATVPVMLLDLAPFALGAVLLAVATGRPLFAGIVIAALGAGFCLADHTMRETLREPVVFSASVELPQLFTHPHLYLPFAGPGLVLGGALIAFLTAAALLVLEPPAWRPRPLAALALATLTAAAIRSGSRERPVSLMAAALRRIARPSGEPVADAASLGPFAMLLVHTTIARAERGSHRQQFALRSDAPQTREFEPRCSGGRRSTTGRRVGAQSRACPIIIVQCESFFDARRLSPTIPPERLAGFAACVASSARFGRLGVPGWGANTMRAEFAVLTGIPEAELGYERFNPYYALARSPIESHVWRLRRAGWRTICLHPFDRRFFRRDLVMPALGFERFLGRETLGGTRTPPYYPDPDLARDILRIVDREGPETFVFAITMGNHGPWPGRGPPIDRVVAQPDPDDVADGTGLSRYLDGLQRSDAMLQILIGGLERRGGASVLAFYGDHLPSLPRAFARFGFAETSTDYVIWNGDGAAAERRDIPAHRLGQSVIDIALATPHERHAGTQARPPVRVS